MHTAIPAVICLRRFRNSSYTTGLDPEVVTLDDLLLTFVLLLDMRTVENWVTVEEDPRRTQLKCLSEVPLVSGGDDEWCHKEQKRVRTPRTRFGWTEENAVQTTLTCDIHYRTKDVTWHKFCCTCCSPCGARGAEA